MNYSVKLEFGIFPSNTKKVDFYVLDKIDTILHEDSVNSIKEFLSACRKLEPLLDEFMNNCAEEGV